MEGKSGNTAGKEKVCKLSQLAPINEVRPSFPESYHALRKTQPEKNNESILQIYKSLVYTCRALGVCPIQISGRENDLHFRFEFFSCTTLVNGTISGVTLCFYVWWLLQQRTPTPTWHYLEAASSRENGTIKCHVESRVVSSGCRSYLMVLLQRILPLQLPVNTCLNIIASLLSVSRFAEILSTWAQYEKKFQNKLKTSKLPFKDIASTKRKLALLYIVFGSTYIALVISVTRPKCSIKHFCPLWRHIVGVLVVFPYITYTFLEDFKYLLMFRTLEEGFRQMSDEILEHNNKAVFPSNNNYLPTLVTLWQDLILDLRQQTRLVSKCSSLHHVVSISTTFFSLLVGVYFSVAFQFTEALEKDKGNIAYAAMGFCVVSFARCLVKTSGSERILNQEKNLVNQLSYVKTGEDFKTQVKINALIDLIGREPAQITIYDCFKLNTSFLFQIIGQIATYLIVFLQFEKM